MTDDKLIILALLHLEKPIKVSTNEYYQYVRHNS